MSAFRVRFVDLRVKEPINYHHHSSPDRMKKPTPCGIPLIQHEESWPGLWGVLKAFRLLQTHLSLLKTSLKFLKTFWPLYTPKTSSSPDAYKVPKKRTLSRRSQA